MKRRQFTRAALSLGLLGGSWSCNSNAAMSTRIVLGFPPGASGDALLRKIAQKMSGLLDRGVIVDNRPGAGGRIALDYTRAAAANGETLVFTPSTPLTSDPWLYKLDYDPFKDFRPIAYVASFKYVLAVNPQVPANNLKEFLTLAAQQPKLCFYSATAPGGAAHMGMASLSREAKVPMTFVPYRGTANALVDLLADRLGAFMGTVADLLALSQQGKVRLLGVPSEQRSSFLPHVQTFKEQGFEVDAAGWYGMYAPPQTPDAIAGQLTDSVVKATQDPDVQSMAAVLGLTVQGRGPQDLAKIQRADYVEMGREIKASGFKIEV